MGYVDGGCAMKRVNVEIGVGVFMILGLAGFFYLAINMGDVSLLGSETYRVQARFGNTSGLKEGAYVELSGVRIGKVSKIELDRDSYDSIVELSIPNEVQLQEDSIASIRTAGIIGDKFIKVTPGGLDEYIEAGGEIIETESSLDVEELISKYIFDSGIDAGKKN